VMSYLVYVNQTYKEEMSQVLSSDPLLKQELEYDMKQFEQSRRAAARRAGGARGTPFSKAFPSLTPHTARRASVSHSFPCSNVGERRKTPNFVIGLNCGLVAVDAAARRRRTRRSERLQACVSEQASSYGPHPFAGTAGGSATVHPGVHVQAASG
jgi:hypothetical protein